ncbi:MAG: hypothetical protein H7843_04590 [Nitrospirota bacterium]
MEGEDIYSYFGDIWLHSAKNPAEKEFLFSFRHYAKVLISPDEKWLVIKHRLGFAMIDAILFKNVDGLKYKEVKYLNHMAWTLFRDTHKQYKLNEFIDTYVEAMEWSSDSKSILIQVNRHDENSPKDTEPWYCIYDLTTDKMSLDFKRVFNRNTYQPSVNDKD